MKIIRFYQSLFYLIEIRNQCKRYLFMQNIDYIQEVVVVGGGPVGNFSAVMIAMLGIKCTVYEKRDGYTRQLNLKIQKDFFMDISTIMKRISRRHRPFFEQLDEAIKNKNGKIVLKDLQSKLKQEAIELGVKYIKKQIKSFEQVELLHKSNPLILDCTGRNSFLRVNKFGDDQHNMKIYNLHHALHINFKAVIPKNFNFQLLYPVIKNSDNLKLGQIIVSKNKQNKDEKYSHVTVPLFISDQLSDIIDKNYPNINRNPLKPFAVGEKEVNIDIEVLDVIHSLFCALVMEDWDVEWSGVVLKKINITCGFAVGRSQGRHICLGDSAAHFAYFKSLNFGLKHAFQLVRILTSYHSIKYELGPFDQKLIVDRCWKKNPQLWPVKARQGPSPCQYFITNSQLKILTPYLYDLRTDKVSIIDILPQIKQQKIEQKFEKYINEVHEKSWVDYLNKFESIRKFDIDTEIMSNRNKKAGTEVVAYFIWLNGLSPIKLSETISLMANGYYLEKKDFEYFGETISDIKSSTKDWSTLTKKIKKKSSEILQQRKNIPTEYKQFLTKLSTTSEQISSKQQLCDTILSHKIQDKSNKNKQLCLLTKAFQIVAYVISKQDKDNEKDQEKVEQKMNQRQEKMVQL